MGAGGSRRARMAGADHGGEQPDHDVGHEDHDDVDDDVKIHSFFPSHFSKLFKEEIMSWTQGRSPSPVYKSQ